MLPELNTRRTTISNAAIRSWTIFLLFVTELMYIECIFVLQVRKTMVKELIYIHKLHILNVLVWYLLWELRNLFN